ncbi:hypothetical protein BZG02_08215 [Labilibaculum filiforme]|uniref:Mechanosensitive ion channel MscS domain-containing protein n=2 Tax=Labilibaculum filiforme TaxID=1940526 RepID=A0A2N3HZ83_9BACT|nr:hypothetical protein BZG02_08215 [Labilibaculum filiforme]
MFRLLGFINRSLKYSPTFKHHSTYLLTILELLLWLGIVIGLVKQYYFSQNIFGLVSLGIVIVIAIIPSFYLLRDFFSGVYLKIQDKVREGSIVEINDLKGKIEKLGNFSLNLIDKHGDIKSIPYHKISATIISKQSNNANLNKVNLKFFFPRAVQTNYIIPKLKVEIINTPWVALSQPVLIENIEHVNDEYFIEVVIYTLQPHFAEDIKNRVDENIKNYY